MPELPEVETVRSGLEELIVGRKILNVEILNPKSFQAAPNDAKQFLIGAKIIAVRRRAKLLIIDLATDYSLAIHLKMTGQIVFRGSENWGGGHPNNSFVEELPNKSTRVIFDLSVSQNKDSASADKVSKSALRGASPSLTDSETLSAPLAENSAKLFFNDQRKFGWVKLLPTAEIAEMEFVKKLGPEPLTGNPEKEFLKRVRRRNNTTIKAAILDQSVVAGIGNIYADEALWAAKIHPASRVKNLTDDQLCDILNGAIETMTKAIESGGSTMKDYIKADGTKGNYLDKFAKVFRREGQPCPRCGQTIEKIRVAGRGTHICPNCQKIIE